MCADGDISGIDTLIGQYVRGKCWHRERPNVSSVSNGWVTDKCAPVLVAQARHCLYDVALPE